MDLGSAGGTFVRVVKDNEVRVKRGMMVMVGKHQLVFSRPGEEVRSPERSEAQAKRGPSSAKLGLTLKRSVLTFVINSHLALSLTT